MLFSEEKKLMMLLLFFYYPQQKGFLTVLIHGIGEKQLKSYTQFKWMDKSHANHQIIIYLDCCIWMKFEFEVRNGHKVHRYWSYFVGSFPFSKYLFSVAVAFSFPFVFFMWYRIEYIQLTLENNQSSVQSTQWQ